jgi:ATP-dependent DNA helicase RecQ
MRVAPSVGRSVSAFADSLPVTEHPEPAPTLTDAERALSEIWGYPGFRTHQRPVVVAALQGRDCLAVLPTGGGKSLCFQVPALMLPGLTLVVSPLISLMQDQVAALRARRVAAAYLSSTQTPSQRAAVLDALNADRLKLLYVAPERLATMAAGLAGRVSLLAVDEAHCISEWGHDFRPHFRAIGRQRAALARPPTIALTGTATPDTRADIIRVLGLRRPAVVVRSFDRPNLTFNVRRVEGEVERLREAVRLLRQLRTGTSIIYVSTRNRTDGVAQVLRRNGIRALPYHAGLPAKERRGILARFLDNRCRVVVATSAFGMGIDKPDVRLVLHLGVPARPESYYQEAGRAGRDGLPSRCVMLWRPGDLELTARLGEAAPSSDRSPGSLAGRRAGIAAMRRYLDTRGCRRRVLLDYLGEAPETCSGCDRCGGAHAEGVK